MTSSTPRPSRPSAARLAAASTLSGADHLVVDGVSRSFADHRVLTDISFTVSSGERACLIGENGTGKTTLLRIIAGLDDDHAGRISAPGSTGLYHQQPAFELTLSVEQVLAQATAPQRHLVEEVARLAEALAVGQRPPGDRLVTAYDRALAEAARTRAWDVGHVVDRVVEGLGLAGVPRDRRAGELSGGQVSRLSLAWLLLRRPDTLLLDEPTNHLDDRGTALLVDLLAGWSGPVLIASHDRAFLDEAATSLLDLDPAPGLHRDAGAAGGDGDGADGNGGGAGVGVTRFGGTYTQYLLHRIDERARWERRYREEQDELRRLRRQMAQNHTVGHADRPPRTEGKMAQKFYSDRNATVVRRRVNDAATALARLERAQVRRPPPVLRFTGLAAATAGGGPDGRGDRPASSAPVLAATGVGLAGRLAPVSVALGARSRLLVTGPNGAGKTTLLRILAGDLEPDAGSVSARSDGAGGRSVGMLGQEPRTMDPDETVAEAYRAAVGIETAERVPLGTFGLLTARDEGQPVGVLSVGQRRRLDLAMLLADPPEVLLLDEPTNHFSLLLATRLEASVPDYPGAVVIASHDRWLRSGWRGERLELSLPSGPGN
ncbi:ABC-F family ATP-binding cassette domain-containing protein [Citricoccus sp.]|uniref:ABC-F family ATP-binding cassette domain-containing protein n=1 Tax=Citricoccus sp. TaxID=1978372 RepID=UPI002601C621|nr:ATP-binding cassette domain-containing protein [Citricoccus sp.]HRO30807.1 ATP-binding cassette domain-containing protein [Citricoccus sp.]